jgi:hypothetical protein
VQKMVHKNGVFEISIFVIFAIFSGGFVFIQGTWKAVAGVPKNGATFDFCDFFGFFWIVWVFFDFLDFFLDFWFF